MTKGAIAEIRIWSMRVTGHGHELPALLPLLRPHRLRFPGSGQGFGKRQTLVVGVTELEANTGSATHVCPPLQAVHPHLADREEKIEIT